MRANPTASLISARTALFALALLCPSLLSAQQLNLATHIDATAAALSQLDSKAGDCLLALDAGTDSKTPCDDFMQAIDGALVADYLQRCKELKNWRDGYVERRVATDLDVDDGNSVEMLQRLIAIEYNCAEDSLIAHTEFVSTAFNRLRGDTAVVSARANADAASLSRQLSEQNLSALDESERLRLLDALRSQQNRSQRETERQFDDLELELLRQQIRSANRARD